MGFIKKGILRLFFISCITLQISNTAYAGSVYVTPDAYYHPTLSGVVYFEASVEMSGNFEYCSYYLMAASPPNTIYRGTKISAVATKFDTRDLPSGQYRLNTHCTSSSTRNGGIFVPGDTAIAWATYQILNSPTQTPTKSSSPTTTIRTATPTRTPTRTQTRTSPTPQSNPSFTPTKNPSAGKPNPTNAPESTPPVLPTSAVNPTQVPTLVQNSPVPTIAQDESPAADTPEKKKEERFLYIKALDEETEQGIKNAKIKFSTESGASTVKTGETGEVIIAFPLKTKLTLTIKVKGYLDVPNKKVKLSKDKFLVFKVHRKTKAGF